MALAKEVGLTVATVEPLRAGDRQALLVERYDRFREGSRVRRLHQEDFCQATARPPEAKYESEGGPGVAECGALVRAHAAGPGAALLRFLDALGIARRRVRQHAEDIAVTALRSRPVVRERLEDPWQDDPILDPIDETVELFAGVLGAAAAERA